MLGLVGVRLWGAGVYGQGLVGKALRFHPAGSRGRAFAHASHVPRKEDTYTCTTVLKLVLKPSSHAEGLFLPSFLYLSSHWR